MAKWELVILVCCLHRSRSEYITLTEASNYAEARVMCNDMGGKLPLPTDDNENAQLAAYMMTTGLSKTWLDAKLIRSPWHKRFGGNITFGYDQGCHSLPPQIDSPDWFVTAKGCIKRCDDRFNMFVAMRVSQLLGWRCECFNSTRFLPMLPEQNCSITCPHWYGCWYNKHHEQYAYRVLSTSHVDVTWTRQWRDATVYDLQEALCTSVHDDDDDEDDAYQQQEYCYSLHPSICCIESGAEVLTPLTWFEAHYSCWLKGGFIGSPGDSCRARGGIHNENEENMWSDLRAWMWEIGGRVGEEHIYTNWSHTEPRFTRGECVVLTAEHLWETANCTQPSNFACVTVSEETTSIGVSAISSTLSSDNNTSAQAISSTSRTIGIAVGVAVAAVLVIAVVVVIIIRFQRRRSNPPTNTPNHHTNATYFSKEDDVIIGDEIKHKRQGDGKVNEFVDIKDNSVYVSSDASDYTELRKDTHDDRHYEVVRGVDGERDGTLVVENELYAEKDLADPEQ